MRIATLLARIGGGAFSAGLLAACVPNVIPTVAHVDLERFMGRWYVLGNIPTFIEKGAHNAVESYALEANGSIATTFTFRRDAFDGLGYDVTQLVPVPQRW